MNLQPLQTTCSKAEELETLKKVKKIFPDGTFIHDFLSEKVFSWIDSQMKDDSYTDIFQLIDWLREEIARIGTTANKAREELETMTRKYNKETQEHKREIEGLTRDLENTRQWNNDLEIQRETEYRKRFAAECRASRAEGEKQALETQIIKLKAQLYDYQNQATRKEETQYDEIPD